MSYVNADSYAVLKVWQNIKDAVSSIENTKSSINRKYQQLGADWTDKKHKELGEIIQECNRALNSMLKTLLQGEKYLALLVKSLQEYENTNFSANGISANNGTSDSNYSSTGLNHTNQTSENYVLNGRNVTVFDHPFAENSGRICNQGSAYPTGPQQTCGCCACATIINKAGGTANEHNMVAYAWNNQYCDNEGRTTPQNWASILNGNNVSASVTNGTSLPNLASYVEHGRGVIIGVDARAYAPDMYQSHGGHAMVLESVIRDSDTGEILEYVVADSNGTNSQNASRRVSASRLERAFERFGSMSVCTDRIIW